MTAAASQAPILVASFDPDVAQPACLGVSRLGRPSLTCPDPARYEPRRGDPPPAALILDLDHPPRARVAADTAGKNDGEWDAALATLADWRERLPRTRRGATPTPILAVSARGGQRLDAFEKLLRHGVHDCLPKPLDPRRLAWKLERLLAPPVPPVDDLPDGIRFAFENVVRRHGRLRDFAGLYGGVSPRHPGFRRLAPPAGARWRGVLSGQGIEAFRAGSPSSYVYWHKRTLFRLPTPEEYVGEKVVVNRLAPPMVAAVDIGSHPVAGDALSVTPREEGCCGAVACLLNSRVMDFYFNRCWTRGRTGDSRLTPEDLGSAPWALPEGPALTSLERIAKMLRYYGPRPATRADRAARADALTEMNRIVFALYGFGEPEQTLLRERHF